jgi:hypothetical protein
MKAVRRKIEITTPAGERLIVRSKEEYDAALAGVWALEGPDAEVGLRWLRDEDPAVSADVCDAQAKGAA